MSTQQSTNPDPFAPSTPSGLDPDRDDTLDVETTDDGSIDVEPGSVEWDVTTHGQPPEGVQYKVIGGDDPRVDGFYPKDDEDESADDDSED